MIKYLINMLFLLSSSVVWADAVFIRCPSPDTITVQHIASSGFNYRTWTQNGSRIPSEIFTDKAVPGASFIQKDSVGLESIAREGDTIVCTYYYLIGNPKTDVEKGPQILQLADNQLFAKGSKLSQHFNENQCYLLNTPEYDLREDQVQKLPIGLLCVNDVQIVSGDRASTTFSISEYEKDYYYELLRQTNVID